MEEGSACKVCVERESHVRVLLGVQERMAEALRQSQILLREPTEQLPQSALGKKEAELSML